MAIGGLATIVGGIVYTLGWLDRLNGYNLDLHFRRLSTIDADPRIVLIDIDDSTLAAMPDWPWPRRVHADLVRTLHELGARTIVLDHIFSEPSSPRAEHAGLGQDYDKDAELPELGSRAFDEIIFDDNELRDAMAAAGNVYLAMFTRVGPPPCATTVSAVASLRPTDTLLTEQWYTAMSDETAGRPACRARQAARRFLRAKPDGTWPEFFREVAPHEPFDALTPQRKTLLLAFNREKAMRAVFAKPPFLGSTLPDRVTLADDPMPPIEKLARAAAGVGIVSFHREESQTVVRVLPLVVKCGDVLLAQLGLRVAMDVAGIPPSLISDTAGAGTVGDLSHRRQILTDPTGATLVNWYRPRRGEDWRDAFRHLPAARLLEVVQNRRAIDDNARRLAIARAELVEARHAETPGEYTDYVRMVNEQLELERARTRSSSPSPQPSPLKGEGERLAALNQEIRLIEDEAIVWVQRARQLWRDETPQNEQETAEKERIERLYDRFGDGQYAAKLARANAKLEDRNRQLLEDLRPQVRDGICLVGYTATALGDLVATPVDPAMPGVMVHANVINMFLQNRFALEAPRGLNLAIILLAGCVTSLTSCARGSRFSLLSLFVLVAGILGVGAALFWTITYHMASLVVVATVILVWASVTVYRQATEERARRAFQRALAQYTSPAVAARIAERTKADDLAPQQALVTCFFSDLADFTRLSERLGPQQTRQLLDPYLRGVSAALLDHNAIINKFMGDGVFAFFNAPILPCTNHARAACDSALASLAAVGRCNDQRRQSRLVRESILAPDDSLTVRIGLSTGVAFIGDYGSDMKLDYTCIGDTVNLGSRLERANKSFGTAILVDDATRKAAGDGFVFRSLGLIEVEGRSAAVAVHELVGRVNSQAEPAREQSP